MISYIFGCVKSANASAFREVSGATVHECEALESAAGVPLPRAYAQFLALMGRSTGVALVRDYDFSINSMLDCLESMTGMKGKLPIGVGREPDFVALSLKSSMARDDPPVCFSYDDDHEVDPDLVVAPRFSSFLARALFCEGVLKRQKYVSYIVPVVTPLYVRLTEIVNFDREFEACIASLGARRFFGAMVTGCPAYVAADSYICYVRWPGRRTFAVHVGSDNRMFSDSVRKVMSECFKLEMECDLS